MEEETTFSRKGETLIVRIGGKKSLRVVDNGNGFTIKSYSFSSIEPDPYWNLPYNVAGELMDALKYFAFR